MPIADAKRAPGNCTTKKTQDKGRETQRLSRLELEKSKPAKLAAITPDHSMWSCEGFCGFHCVETLLLPSFDNVSDFTAAQWLLSHGLIQTKCDKRRCHGVLVLSEKNGGIKLKCETCHEYCVKSENTKFFINTQKLSIVKRVALIYHIISG